METVDHVCLQLTVEIEREKTPNFFLQFYRTIIGLSAFFCIFSCI